MIVMAVMIVIMGMPVDMRVGMLVAIVLMLMVMFVSIMFMGVWVSGAFVFVGMFVMIMMRIMYFEVIRFSASAGFAHKLSF